MVLLGLLLAAALARAEEPSVEADTPPAEADAPAPEAEVTAEPAAEEPAAEEPAPPQRPRLTDDEVRARFPDLDAWRRRTQGRAVLAVTGGSVGFLAGYVGFQVETVDAETAPMALGTSLAMGWGIAGLAHGTVGLTAAGGVRSALRGDDPTLATTRRDAGQRLLARTDLGTGVALGAVSVPFFIWGAALVPQSEHDAVAAASTGGGLLVAGAGMAVIGLVRARALGHASDLSAAPALLVVPGRDGAHPLAGLEGRW